MKTRKNEQTIPGYLNVNSQASGSSPVARLSRGRQHVSRGPTWKFDKEIICIWSYNLFIKRGLDAKDNYLEGHGRKLLRNTGFREHSVYTASWTMLKSVNHRGRLMGRRQKYEKMTARHHQIASCMAAFCQWKLDHTCYSATLRRL